ncbi:hypothetical protein J6590_088274 [Homalodisca vitripennis]|nr:hypothetical protein J6590_088274 [Homalodisca vitripennis]
MVIVSTSMVFSSRELHFHPLSTGCLDSKIGCEGDLWPREPGDVPRGKVRAKNTSLTLNLGINGLKVTSEPPQWPGRRAACKDRIAQRSRIQAAATLHEVSIVCNESRVTDSKYVLPGSSSVVNSIK